VEDTDVSISNQRVGQRYRCAPSSAQLHASHLAEFCRPVDKLDAILACQTLQFSEFFHESSEFCRDHRDSKDFDKMDSIAVQRLTSPAENHPDAKFEKPRAPSGFWQLCNQPLLQN
jgi:hypothetical protein